MIPDFSDVSCGTISHNLHDHQTSILNIIFFTIGLYPQAPVHNWSSWIIMLTVGRLEHATLITLKMEMVIEMEMCSWDGKLATQVEGTFEFALAHLVLGHGSHNHAFIISTSCNNCDGDISLQTCRSYHDYCK